MHYYTHNIGEFALETRGLSYEEIGIYISLLDRYASTQKPITSNWVALAYKGESKCKALALLDALFASSDDGWTHPRISELLEKYEETAEKRRLAGSKGGKARRGKSSVAPETIDMSGEVASAEQVHSKCLPDASQPITNNQEPRTNKNNISASADAERVCSSLDSGKVIGKPSGKALGKPSVKPSGKALDFYGLPEALVSDWQTARKAQKAPITQTVIDGFAKEARKAGISLEEAVRVSIERGWRGFKADWVKDDREIDNPFRVRPQKPAQPQPKPEDNPFRVKPAKTVPPWNLDEPEFDEGVADMVGRMLG